MNNTGSAILICFGTYLLWQHYLWGWLLVAGGILSWLMITHKVDNERYLSLQIRKLELEIKQLEKKMK